MTHPTPDSQITPEMKLTIALDALDLATRRDVSWYSDDYYTARKAVESLVRELVEEARKEGMWTVIPGHGDEPDGIVPQ